MSILTLTGCPPSKCHSSHIQAEQRDNTRGWDWYSTPRIRALDVDTRTDDFLNAGYKGWRRKDLAVVPAESMCISEPMNGPFAPILTSSTTTWNATCDVDETIQVKPLSEMLEALPKR